MATVSHWKRVRVPRFLALRKPMRVDVLVVGGGMTGITAAYLLKRAGLTVALVERDRCCQQDTGNTTAHLTCVTDLRLHKLVKSFGRDHAQAIWDAGLAAIGQIEAITQREKIACEFTRVPGYLFASLDSSKDESKQLKRDAELAQELGFAAEFLSQVPLFERPGVRFPNQAKFHPLMYLAELVNRIQGDGSHVFEHSEATEFERDEQEKHIRVTVRNHTVTCDYVVIATDVPLTGLSDTSSAGLLQARLAPYTSYVVGASLSPGSAPVASYWDTSNPYYYLRIDAGKPRDYAVFGGLDHKTGQVEETSEIFERLTAKLLEYLPQAKVDRRWSGQVIESSDGLPLIGETADRQYVATGYSGNGITFGTLAAMMICDAIAGRKNPWRELFAPDRSSLRRGVWNYVTENLEYPYYMVKDRLARAESDSLRSMKRGEGKILQVDGRRVAAYRDDRGRATVLAPECTHMGCIVHWNEAEQSWDCPCHGSRFTATGKILAGPAETGLEQLDIANHDAGDNKHKNKSSSKRKRATARSARS